jgi:hypothetical protein
MNVPEMLSALIRRFPQHASQIDAWEPEYRAVFGKSSPGDLRAMLDRCLAQWTKIHPPRPAELREHLPRRQDSRTREDGLAYLVKDSEGSDCWRCTREGFARAREIKHQIIAAMLREVRLPLAPVAATWLAANHADEAWMLAQHQVLDHQVRSITLTAEEFAQAQTLATLGFEPQPEAKARARAHDHAMARGLPWPQPSEQEIAESMHRAAEALAATQEAELPVRSGEMNAPADAR